MFGELSSCCCLPRLLNLLAAFSQPGNDLIEIPYTTKPIEGGIWFFFILLQESRQYHPQFTRIAPKIRQNVLQIAN